jgi:predicted NBD/HSP70 family sugar kinase
VADVAVEAGVCIGLGGTNARVAGCEGGDITGFNSIVTPTEPDQFFGWLARNLLDASHEGSQWLVAGFPGPVSEDGRTVGPMANVAGMNRERYDIRGQLIAADSEVRRVLDQGFVLLAVNDGTLAAQAAASRIGEHKYDKTGALIIGTGVGAGVVEKDPDHDTVHHVDTTNPLEIGHLMLSGDPEDRFEDRYSGPGMKKRYGMDPKDIPAEHPAWAEEGMAVNRLALTLGLMSGVELVVPTGGVGAGASSKLEPHVREFAQDIAAHGNGPQKLFMPDIKLVPPKEAAEFELYGGEGVMRDYLIAIA